jgi:iron(II)-dependent oxidoreductase
VGAGTDIGGDRAGATHAPPRAASEIAAALVGAREYTLAIYAHLDDDALRFPRRPEVNPPRWEIGHVGWFQEFWCRRYRPDDLRGARTAPRLADADRWWDSGRVPHDTRWDLPLPDWDGIRAYLAATLRDALARLDEARDGERYFHELALYHEDMHGEALLMTLQTLALPAPPWLVPTATPHAGPATDVAIDGGAFAIGAAPGDASRRFVFDNEKWAHEVVLAPYAIAARPVTCAEYAAFVDDGGYDRALLWSRPGREWRERGGRRMPANWRRARGGGYECRRFDAWTPVDPDAPVVNVCAHEAEAFCAWARRRLPTEAEWECAARAGAIAAPGAVWEWTATPFRPYPGFVADPYAEYSAPWFGDHRAMRGGSWATRTRLVHPRFRNFYRPDRHDPFVGLRTCALD